VSGAVIRPRVSQRTFAAWFTSWSMPTKRKSAHMISTIGRRPTMAAPSAAPSIALSEIGVEDPVAVLVGEPAGDA
jgi:hypothetical protein